MCLISVTLSFEMRFELLSRGGRLFFCFTDLIKFAVVVKEVVVVVVFAAFFPPR